MEWKQKTGRYITGEDLFLGKWIVACVFYDAGVKKGDPYSWAATCGLPGIKSIIGHYPDIDSAKKLAEAAVKHWLDKATLGMMRTNDDGNHRAHRI